jgi:hypothetical protein
MLQSKSASTLHVVYHLILIMTFTGVLVVFFLMSNILKDRPKTCQRCFLLGGITGATFMMKVGSGVSEISLISWGLTQAILLSAQEL